MLVMTKSGNYNMQSANKGRTELGRPCIIGRGLVSKQPICSRNEKHSQRSISTVAYLVSKSTLFRLFFSMRIDINIILLSVIHLGHLNIITNSHVMRLCFMLVPVST